MKIQRGYVKYQGRTDIVCTYGVNDSGEKYYFLDPTDGNKLKNGNRIATTVLVEAVDHMVKASHVGVIDENGKEIIPFVNRNIKSVNDDIILVELATPITQSVVEAISLKSDPLAATKLVSTPALIKDKLNTRTGNTGRYVFNDQFSEATVCDINGNNLVNGEYFSFIMLTNDKLYFSKNTADSEITEYSILPPQVQSDVTPANDNQQINVSDVSVSKDVVEAALTGGSMFASNSVDVQPDLPSIDGVDDSVKEENQVVEGAVGTVESEVVIPKVEEDVPVVESQDVPVEEAVTEKVEAPVESVPVVAEETAENISETTEKVVADEEVKVAGEPVEEAVAEKVEDTPVDTVEKVETKEAVQISNEESNTIELDDLEDSELNINIDESEKEDSSSLDSMINGVKDAEEEADGIFSESFVADNIDTNMDEEFSDGSFEYEAIDETDEEFGHDGDSIMLEDVARSMADLIRQNKELKEQLEEKKIVISKLNSSRENAVTKAKMLEQKNSVLSDELKSTRGKLGNASSKVQLLEDKSRQQDEVIRRQNIELNEFKSQLKGKEDLVKLLEDAAQILGNDSSSYDDNSYFGKVA